MRQGRRNFVPGGFTMKQAISFITLGVGDLARSRAFYRALGWRESAGSQAEVAFFQAGSVAFALFARDALAEDADMPAAGSGFPGFTLAHNVAAGGRLVRLGERAPWGGFRGYFADPDGFLWEVCFNPFFPLDEDGFVRLPAAS
jgi:catechol 2,3-dioxygenase-like lactoylglutathione lyase family enzyme